MRLIANWRNSRANIAKDRGDRDKAISLYRAAIKSDPSWSVPWYNLGLLAKYENDWPTSLSCNQEAVRRNSEDEGAWWNLGIAATALGDWSEARRAWSAYGIKIADGSGEIVENFGATPIRINPDGDGEVVWTRRIDPARAWITSVPLPESNRRHRDLLLHDGAPNGYRLFNGKEVPVFNELQVLKSSGLGTFETTVTVDSVDDLADLEETFGMEGFGAEDWSSIRYICRSCSEGRPHERHDRGPAHSAGERKIGVGAPSEEIARQLIHEWASKKPARRSAEMTVLLPPRLSSVG